jgi:hypothetical protein
MKLKLKLFILYLIPLTIKVIALNNTQLLLVQL